MKRVFRNGFFFLALGTLMLSQLSCGNASDNSQPNAGAPAPAPTNPVPPQTPTTPVPPVAPGIPGSACPLATGTPFSPYGTNVYNADLYPYGGYPYYGATSKLSLSIAYVSTPVTGPYVQPQYILGSGQIILTDIQPTPANPTTGYSTCVSSAGGAPGTVLVQNPYISNPQYAPPSQLSIELRGQISFSSPYGYPTQSQMVQVLVGYDCPAYIVPGSRIEGCVRVIIPSTSPYLPPTVQMYQAQ